MLNFYEWMKENNINTPLPVDDKKDDLQIANIIYIGAILTKDSQKALYKAISRRVAIPDDWQKFCHHMTIRFIGAKPVDDVKLPVFGEDITLIVTEIAADEKGVCVRVEPNTNRGELHMPPDQIPHITVATAKGTPPVYSNELLRKGVGFKMTQALPLAAYIGAKMKGGSIMPERSDAALENFKPDSEPASQE